MNTQLSLSYNLSHPIDWYKVFEDQHLGRIKDNRIILDKNLGTGYLECIDFQPGFWAQHMNVKLSLSLELLQKPISVNELFIINFYLSNADIRLKNTDREINFQYDNVSVVLTSSATGNHYEVPIDKQINVFQIGFTRDWLLENAINEPEGCLKSVLENDEPIFLVESLDYKYKHLLTEIDLHKHSRLFLFSRVMQLLNFFFTKLEERDAENLKSSNIHEVDLDALKEVKAFMDSYPMEAISVEELALKANMSLSKFKGLFKQVYGETPYQYRLKTKMKIAMEMLMEGNHSVSDTGYLIGYANLSQFSKAFKSHFGVLPSEVKLLV